MGRVQTLPHLDVSRHQELQVPMGNQGLAPKCLEGSSFVTWEKVYKSHLGTIQLQCTRRGVLYEHYSYRGWDVQ